MIRSLSQSELTVKEVVDNACACIKPDMIPGNVKVKLVMKEIPKVRLNMQLRYMERKRQKRSRASVLLKFMFLSLLLLPLGAAGQNEGKLFKRPRTAKESMEFCRPPVIRETDAYGKDRNHESEWMSDIRFNLRWLPICYTLNGEYVGPSPLGIDLYAYEEEKLSLPYVVRGIGPANATLTVNYTNEELEEKGLHYYILGDMLGGFINYKSDHPVRLMTLDEIRKEYCPKVKEGKVLYMINKFFILLDVEYYKVAQEFIWGVEVLPSEYLTPIEDNIKEPFTIIRIFTKTHHNWHQTYID